MVIRVKRSRTAWKRGFVGACPVPVIKLLAYYLEVRDCFIDTPVLVQRMSSSKTFISRNRE